MDAVRRATQGAVAEVERSSGEGSIESHSRDLSVSDSDFGRRSHELCLRGPSTCHPANLTPFSPSTGLFPSKLHYPIRVPGFSVIRG
jgi:hypothetical protein